jgi:hypothetical protein
MRLTLALTLAGAIPFVALASAPLWVGEDGALRTWAATALALYGGVILSFLGGIRWGAAIAAGAGRAQGHEVALSVLPPLAGWGLSFWAVFGAGFAIALWAMAGVFAVQWLWDRAAWASGRLPEWFATERTLASAMAVASLVLGGALVG